MTQQVILPVAGLTTDPGPFTAAPEGSLVEAQNVVVLRPGVIEPRPGAVLYADPTAKGAGASFIAAYRDRNGTLWAWSTTTLYKTLAGTISGPTAFVSGLTNTCPTGGRALFTAAAGVCTLPSQPASPASGSTTVAYRAGLPQPAAPAWSLGTGGAIPTATRIRYRVTIRRRLANGTVIESPPSNPIDVLTTAANQKIFFHGSVGPTDPYFAYRTDNWTSGGYAELIAGDELCIYRSPSVTPFSVDPGDELRLRAVIPYNAANEAFCDPANPPAPWADKLADTQWDGPPLYTNDTQETIAQANYRPEYARDMDLYRGMTFYAGATSTQRLDLHLNAIGGTSSPETALINYTFAGTGTTAIGSPTITAIGATDMGFLFVGQVLQNSGISPLAAAAFPAQTRIVSLTATTATMSANALTAGAVTFVAWDWIDIIAGGQTQRAYVAGAGPFPTNYTIGVTAFRQTWGADGGGQGMENWLNNYPASVGIGNSGSRMRRVQTRVSGGTIDPSTLFTTDMTVSFITNDALASAITVRSTKPLAWSRNVDSAVGITSATQGGAAELRWSKTNEPEHVPIPNRSVIGDATMPIRRILSVRNSLLIFKDDGLFQWYGDTPSDYRIELIDSTITIPPSLGSGDEPAKWVGRFGDRVYAMTTRGPMVVGDAGASLVGAPILETLRRAYSAPAESDNSTRAMMVDVANRRIGFFISPTPGAPSLGYVFHVDTGAWVTWTFARPIGGFDATGTTLAGSYVVGNIIDNRTMLDDASLTVSTLPGTCESWGIATCSINEIGDEGGVGVSPYKITIAAGSEWTPAVGDLLIQSGLAHLVVSVTSATVFYTETLPAVGSATWRESYEARVIWVGNAEGSPASEKHWYSMAFPMELQALTQRMKSYVAGYRNASTPIEAYMSSSPSIGVAPYAIAADYKRAIVPTDFGRDWALKAGFTIRQACTWFSTASCALMFSPLAPDKVKR